MVLTRFLAGRGKGVVDIGHEAGSLVCTWRIIGRQCTSELFACVCGREAPCGEAFQLCPRTHPGTYLFSERAWRPTIDDLCKYACQGAMSNQTHPQCIINFEALYFAHFHELPILLHNFSFPISLPRSSITTTRCSSTCMASCALATSTQPVT